MQSCINEWVQVKGGKDNKLKTSFAGEDQCVNARSLAGEQCGTREQLKRRRGKGAERGCQSTATAAEAAEAAAERATRSHQLCK